MSTKRKKTGGNPAGKTVTFIQIYDEDSPWEAGEWYMCGMCGHAINVKEAGKHAKNSHRATSLKLVDVEDTIVTEKEAAKLGKWSGVAGLEVVSGQDGRGKDTPAEE